MLDTYVNNIKTKWKDVIKSFINENPEKWATLNTNLQPEKLDNFLEIYLELEKSHNGKFHESPSIKEGIITDMCQELIDRNYILNPIFTDGKWCEIDTIDDLKNAKILFQ